ncbi:MAG: glycosyltransferase family 2 protein [Deltaproteobacteria bacterium]|nr:MAG: glycosyltransferase family 2 protein [Deltaproteobacteria bacterium]
MSLEKTQKFSLIMATVGRTKEVKRFLEHLDRQTYRDFELIVVDQNPDDRLVPILEAYKKRFPILHLRSERGLSRARNVGLKHISGDVVAFPDDDCWYPPDLLERVARFFREHPDIDVLTGRSVDENGEPSNGRWDNRAGLINQFNIWRRAVSYSIFLKKEVVEKVGGFDESLGVGAGTPWGAGEETDYLLRALERDCYLYYDPEVAVYHPQPVKHHDRKSIAKARTYAAGIGRVLRKHEYPFWFILYSFLRTSVGILLAFAMGHFELARFRWASLKGRVRGWLAEV